MAGPNTGVLCAALESLGLVRNEEQQGPPGSGVPYNVTHDTVEKLREVHRQGKIVVVQDSGEVVIR